MNPRRLVIAGHRTDGAGTPAAAGNTRRLLLGIALFLLAATTLSAQCVMTCRSNINVSLSELGWTKIDPAVVLQFPLGSCRNVKVVIKDSANVAYADTAWCSFIGKKMTVSVIDTTTGNSCWANLKVEDKLPPRLQCDTTFITCDQPAHPDSIGYPKFSDNCTNLQKNDLFYTDVFTDLPCATNIAGVMVTARIDRTWTVRDKSGNSTTCTQRIFFKRATLDDVQFPPNFDDVIQPALECGQNPYDFDLTRYPTVNGRRIVNGSICELAVSYTDQKLPLCGGSFKILREWRVIDWCAGIYKLNVQIIAVKDRKPPVIKCPANLTVNTSTSTCFAGVSLPMATAFDSCSAVTVSVNSAFGSGTGPFALPVGQHVITHTATDACGNTASCTMTIRVVDITPPIAVCDENTVATLSYDGTATIFARSFDDGSHDNCAIDRYLVSRDSGALDTFVKFTCADLPGPIMVRMRVYDKAGNFNDCMVNVKMQEKTPPAITCPADLSVLCSDDVSNTKLTGRPTATDNCAVKSITYKDDNQLNACRIGRIVRTWTATDFYGNSTSCTQLIQLRDTTPVSIVFPADYTAYQCYTPTDTSVTGWPVITGADCEKIGISWFDQVFPFAMPACYKIVRNWQVVDWCKFVPNSNSTEGVWTYQQVIKILDTVPPALTCPKDVTVGITDRCNATVTIPDATALDCSQWVAITNNGTFSTSKGPNAGGNYPQGTHSVVFRAEDGCGNASSCTMKIRVVDVKPPTPVCLNGISITLMPDSSITITPNMIERGGSFDNCTAYQDLRFSVSPSRFTCDHVGYQNIKLFVTDQAGNTSFCISTVYIQDNFGVCKGKDKTASISGTITTEDDREVKNVNIRLSGGMDTLTRTDIAGRYAFGDLPKGYNYYIVPECTDNPANGVTTFDLVQIRKHILGVESLKTPYKMIAADANKSGHISTYDMVLLRQIILKTIDSIPGTNSWRFVPANYQFTDPTDPFKDNFPEGLSGQNITASLINSDFIAIKIGDVNSSADVSNIAGRNDRDDLPLMLLHTAAQKADAGTLIRIPVLAATATPLAACQMTIGFDQDKLEYESAEAGQFTSLGDENIGRRYLANGYLTMSWDETNADAACDPRQPLFYLNFRTKTALSVKEALFVNDAYTPSEAYDRNGSRYRLALRFDRPTTDAPAAELYQNRPNPFGQQTTIGFYLPQPTSAALVITDVTGKTVATLATEGHEGYNELTINQSDLPSAGIFYYHLHTPGNPPLTRKMVLYR